MTSKKSNSPQFLHGKPSVPFSAVFPCFQEENGILFRLVDESSKTCAFYNDSTRYKMSVRIEISADNVTPINTALHLNEKTRYFEGTVVLPPQTTTSIFKGNPVEFNFVFSADDAQEENG